MRDPGGAIECALPFGLGLMAGFVPSGIRARPGVEQHLRCPHETLRPRAVEAQIPREAEVGERVPAAWTRSRRGIGRIALEEPAHGGFVAEDRRRVDVALRDLGVLREERLGALECSQRVVAVERHTGGLDERCPRIVPFRHAR